MRFKQLTFPDGLSERDEHEMQLRGYKSNVLVVMDDGKRFTLTFYDPVRLAQTLEDDAASGNPFLAEPGLVIVPIVTRQAMEHVAKMLTDEGFFSHLVPLDE